jgi:molybdopterin-containing oxidoreductase family iron-sulfur binding subunit
MKADCHDQGRREFIAWGGLGLAAVIAPGVVLFAARPTRAAGVSGAVRWGLLIDTGRCRSGCTVCVDACNRENGLKPARNETDAQWIRKVALKDSRTGRQHSLPMMCQHCEHPPCVDVCPTGASFRRADGIVLVDRHICIGCRYCMFACPYKARSFIHEALSEQKPDVPRGKGCVEACTFCVHRIDRGHATPACVEACNAQAQDAMLFGDLNDKASEIARRVAAEASTQVRADLRLNPGVRYQGI